MSRGLVADSAVFDEDELANALRQDVGGAMSFAFDALVDQPEVSMAKTKYPLVAG